MIKSASRVFTKILAAGGMALVLSVAGVSLASAHSHNSSSDPSGSGSSGRGSQGYDQNYDPSGSGQGSWLDQNSSYDQNSPYGQYDQNNQGGPGGDWRNNQNDNSAIDPSADPTDSSQNDPGVAPNQTGGPWNGGQWQGGYQSGLMNVSMGKVDSVSGNTLTVKGQSGSYQVDVTGATVINRSGKSISPTDVRSGDWVIFQGDGNSGSSAMTAQVVFDLTLS